MVQDYLDNIFIQFLCLFMSVTSVNKVIVCTAKSIYKRR